MKLRFSILPNFCFNKKSFVCIGEDGEKYNLMALVSVIEKAKKEVEFLI